MSIAFIDRLPTASETERFRLFLSGYQNRLYVSYLNEPVSPSLLMSIIASAFDVPISVIAPFYQRKFTSRDDVSIYLKSFFVSENGNFERRKLTRVFDSPEYWKYLSNFDINEENYIDKPLETGVASVNLMYGKKNNLEKSTCLLFFLDNHSTGSEEDKINFALAQYPYFIDPTKLNWLYMEDEDVDQFLRTSDRKASAMFLRGYENHELIFEIKILSSAFYTRSNLRWLMRRDILVSHLMPLHKRIWFSNILQMETLSDLQMMQYGAIATLKKQRELSLSEFEELINQDAKEEMFQRLLEENLWMFGNEYGALLDKREIIPGTQQDFLARRTADNYLEIIEIKRPLNGKELFHGIGREIFYPGADLAQAIGQAIHYIDKAEGYKHNILAEKKEDVNKIRVKTVIGRDGNENQQRAMRNLNSHLHGIEILTYDQLLRIAKRSLAFQ